MSEGGYPLTGNSDQEPISFEEFQQKTNQCGVRDPERGWIVTDDKTQCERQDHFAEIHRPELPET